MENMEVRSKISWFYIPFSPPKYDFKPKNIENKKIENQMLWSYQISPVFVPTLFLFVGTIGTIGKCTEMYILLRYIVLWILL